MAPSNGTSNGNSSSQRLVGRFTEATLLKKAKEVVAEKSKASTMFDEEAEKAMPRFKKSGKKLCVDISCAHFDDETSSHYVKFCISNNQSHYYLSVYLHIQ